MVQEETRKGPWTEQEDIVLVNFVRLFGDRRWDFIAKVSGLNRTGKSCRLRWVNYLNPGLKRGKMTPQEERLVLELHAKWGNRWSKIARKLPGRTDNEIKNYWRTLMRKEAQEKKHAMSSPSSSSSNYSSSSVTTATMLDSLQSPDSGKTSFYDTGGSDFTISDGKKNQELEEYEEGYSMDDIWKEIDASEENAIKPVRDVYSEQGCYLCCPSTASPEWEYSVDSIWRMDAGGNEMSLPIGQYMPCSENGMASFTG